MDHVVDLLSEPSKRLEGQAGDMGGSVGEVVVAWGFWVVLADGLLHGELIEIIVEDGCACLGHGCVGDGG